MEQLFKKDNDRYIEIFPLNYIQSIIDSESGKALTSILNSFNNIYVPYQDTVENTRNMIPESMRRKGLWITYNNGIKYITEYYNGSVNDIKEHWADNLNWQVVPDLELVQSEASKLPDGIITTDKLSPALQELIKQNNNITNLPDDEDLEEINSVLRFKDRKYNAGLASGKGYKILRKNWTKVGDKMINLLTQDMINEANTIYEIRYDFDLNGKEITIPEKCILKFNGGKIDNGVLIISNTGDIVYPNFGKKLKLSKDGIIKNFIDIRSYGVYPDNTDLAYNLSNYIDTPNTVYYFPRGTYYFTNTLSIYQPGVTLIGDCTYTDIMNVNDTKGRGTIFNFNVTSGTSEKQKYCIKFSDSFSSSIEKITIKCNSYQTKDDRTKINGINTVEQIWNTTVNASNVVGVNGGNLNLVKFIGISDYAYKAPDKGAYYSITNCSFTQCSKCIKLTNDCTVNNIKVFYCSYFISMVALNQVTNCRIDSCKYIGITLFDQGNFISNIMFDFCYGYTVDMSGNAEANYLNLICARTAIGGYKKDDKSSYNIRITGNCNNNNINLTIHNSNILDSPTEEIKYLTKGVYFDDGYTGTNNIINIVSNYDLAKDIINKNFNNGVKYFIGYKTLSLINNHIFRCNNIDIESSNGTIFVINSNFIKYSGTYAEKPDLNQGLYTGRFYLCTNKATPENKYNGVPMFFKSDGTWIDALGRIVDDNYPIKTNGNFANKPNDPKIGFAYFCTDKQTTEGTINGIMIYHKGNNVWVDAFGRIVE